MWTLSSFCLSSWFLDCKRFSKFSDIIAHSGTPSYSAILWIILFALSFQEPCSCPSLDSSSSVLLIEDVIKLYFLEIASIVFIMNILLFKYFLRFSSNKSFFSFSNLMILFSYILLSSFLLFSSCFLEIIKSVFNSTSFSSKEFKSRLAFIKTSKDASSAVIIAWFFSIFNF